MKEDRLHLSFTLRSQIPHGVNERWYQDKRIRIAEENGFFHRLGRYWYRNRKVFRNLCCFFGIFEYFTFHTDWLKAKLSHVVENFLIVCLGDGKKVKFTKQCCTELIHVLPVHMFNSFTRSGCAKVLNSSVRSNSLKIRHDHIFETSRFNLMGVESLQICIKLTSCLESSRRRLSHWVRANLASISYKQSICKHLWSSGCESHQ